MAQSKFSTVAESDFSGGIDARSAESDIPAGFAEDLINAEIIEGRARKRRGYQGYAGNIPARVTSITYTGAVSENIEFSLGEGVDLSAVSSSPIVVYGRVSSNPTGTNDFEQTDGVQYYPRWSTKTRKTFTAPATTITVPVTEHGLASNKLFVGVVQSTTDVNNSYSSLLSDTVAITKATDLISVTETTYSTFKGFIFYEDRATVAGSSYAGSSSGSNTTWAVGSGATVAHAITAGNHGLANFDIIAQIYEDTGTTYERITPDEMTIGTTGTVTITITNGTSGSKNYIAFLSAAPIANTQLGTLSALSTTNITLTNVTSPWVFFTVYSDVAGTLMEIIPDSYSYDDVTKDLTITLTNSSSTAYSLRVFWEYGTIRSNQLIVTANTGAVAGFTDTRPQLTIWGLDHANIYGADRDDREGWANHIDSYRRSGEQRLVTGLGGNIFTAKLYSEIATSYLLPQLYPSLQGRLSTDKTIAPLVNDTGDTPARTRGYVTHDGGGGHFSTVTAATYNTGTGWTEYVINMPNLTIYNSAGVAQTLTTSNFAARISTVTNYEDELTIQGMAWAVQDGVFPIKSIIAISANSVTIAVENLNITSTDFDDTASGGLGGVFTDEITLAAGISTFLPDDRILSDGTIGDDLFYTIIATSGNSMIVNGVTSVLVLPTGLKVVGRRTSTIMPLRDGAGSPASTVTNLVEGDMVSYSPVDRLLRVVHIISDVNRSISVSSDGTTATVTMTTGDTTYLVIGRSVTISAGVYSGTQIVTSITNNTEFKFASEIAGTATGTLIGKTAELDEALTWEDSISSDTIITVEARWIPTEAPDDSWTLTPSTYIHHLDADTYREQSFLRSVMVSDNMYLTNGADEVYKLDGTSLYRAGLLPWQPGLFVTQDTNATAKIVNDNPQITVISPVTTLGSTAGATTEFKVALGAQNNFSVGDRVYFFQGTGGSPSGTGTYTVKGTRADASNGFVTLLTGTTTITLGTTAGTAFLQLAKVLKYYFRLNAIDENDNIIASAVTGADDHVMELPTDAANYIRLIGLPAWDNYDYDKLEIEIYRVKSNTAAPFYKLTTLQMKFDNAQGYIDFTDSFADDDLINLDPVNSVLLGTELGTGWSDPLRAKFLTTAGNSLVLSNLKDYPQLDIQIVGDSTLTVSNFENKKLTFRRASAGVGTVTDMLNTAVYEWVDNSAEQAITTITGTVGVSFSVEAAAHGVSVGDWVYLYYNTVTVVDHPLVYAGWWQVRTVTDANHFVVAHTGAQAGVATLFPNSFACATNRKDIPVFLGASTGRDGNMGMLNGNSAFVAFQAMRKMAMAINTTMRMVDVAITGYTTFTPWLTARAGNEFQAGQLIVRQPRVDSDTAEVLLPASFGSLQIFVNGVRKVATNEVSMETRVYPSRVLISYPNYAEIFDRPTVVIDTDSDSAVDVNPADGQEITGQIPFFGDSAFGAAQQGGVVVVFKENSIYLVDIAAKRAGQNPVQKLETQGLGCTAPYSIAHTKDGIVFANESGMYSLGKDLKIQYLGKKMERNWLGSVNRSLLSIAQGHHYSIGRQYKLSVPISSTATENSEAYVYDHSAEEEGRPGAWTRFTQHAATGWANLAQDAYFCTHTGRVMSLRRVGDDTDYRDDSSAIPLTILTRGIDAGAAGIRKIFSSIISYWRTDVNTNNTTVETSTNLRRQFHTTTVFRMPNSVTSDGLSDVANKKILEIRHSVPDRKGSYLQIRIMNSTIDEGIELAGLQLRVAGLTEKGILQAKETTNE